MKFKTHTPNPLPFGFPCYKAFIYVLLVALTILLSLVPVKAESEESFAPYLLASNSLGQTAVSHTASEVEANIDQGVLEGRISQTYENTGESLVECQCVFPLSDNELIHDVEVKINGKRIPYNFTGEFLILELLPNEKLELIVSFIEVFEVEENTLDLI